MYPTAGFVLVWLFPAFGTGELLTQMGCCSLTAFGLQSEEEGKFRFKNLRSPWSFRQIPWPLLFFFPPAWIPRFHARTFFYNKWRWGRFALVPSCFLGRQVLGTQRGLEPLEERGMHFWLMTSSISSGFSSFGFDLRICHSSQGMHVKCTLNARVSALIGDRDSTLAFFNHLVASICPNAR